MAQPADDFTSELVGIHQRDARAISPAEIASVVMGIGVAGHETTTSILGNALRQILPRRELWQTLLDQPARVKDAVEEVLRLDSSLIAWRRRTTEPVQVGGVSIPQGATVLLVLGAANRDPEVFEEPDAFRPGRPNARQHLSFGKGIHFCLGAPLARMQARIMLELLRARWPGMRLVSEQPFEFARNLSFRGVRRLLAVCNADTPSTGAA
jgi:cytochrome P450